ncbi:hypothetical protein SDC9_134887 [bioreactor metagenome]|uniref:Uncharacterized protein n=1 Tax=bioreactor metagenome TaxID=1076179 RepID=A0A645DEU2_9ZZZZ
MLARGIVDEKPFAKRSRAGVDYDNLALGILCHEFFRGRKRALHRAGEFGRKTDVEDVFAGFEYRLKRLEEGEAVDLCGGDGNAGTHLFKECFNMHVRVAGDIEILFLLHGETHREYGDVQLLGKACRKVAGCVGKNAITHAMPRFRALASTQF